MALTLERALDRENNNFNLIRLLAALLVIFGHSFYLFPTNGYNEPLKGILVDDYTGGLAVYIFFFLSGIFITASFVNSKTFVRFILMRVFRIYPALIICNIITVFIVGAVFTTLSLSSYFSSKQTWIYLFHNSLMNVYIANLPGVFVNNLYKVSLNGSLWTLPTEIRCYVLVVILGLFGCFKKNITIIIVVIVSVVFIVFRNHPYMLTYFQGEVKKGMFFLIGMVAYTFRNYLFISKRVAALIIGFCVVTYFINHQLFIALFYLTLIYSVLVVATLSVVKKIKLPGDYSYGIYIYGFLIQQILAHLFPSLNTYPSMLISIPIVFVLGIISWHYIESPALKGAVILSQKYKQYSEAYNKDSQIKSIVSN